MLLQPKKRTFKKVRKGRLTAEVGPHAANLHLNPMRFSLKQGDFGLRAQEGGRLTARQIEASRRVITRSLERKGKLYLRAFPDTPITSRPAGTRMGKGKGSVSHWVAVLKPGQMIFEILGVPEKMALRALKAASKKIPLITGPVIRKLPLGPEQDLFRSY